MTTCALCACRLPCASLRHIRKLNSGFGLALERFGGELRLSTILAGGPAAQAGLREGDVVTRWPGGDTGRPLAELWASVQGRDEIVVGVGQPVREVTLRRALFAPPAVP